MANSAGVPAPSTNSSRTRWPGDLGATIETSTSGRTVIVPKRMLNPWANMTIFPGARFGAISSVYTWDALVSGMRIMMTSAHAETSATSPTLNPASVALARERLAGARPTLTLTPLSRRLSACAWPCDPYPITATFFARISARSAASS